MPKNDNDNKEEEIEDIRGIAIDEAATWWFELFQGISGQQLMFKTKTKMISWIFCIFATRGSHFWKFKIPADEKFLNIIS